LQLLVNGLLVSVSLGCAYFWPRALLQTARAAIYVLLLIVGLALGTGVWRLLLPGYYAAEMHKWSAHAVVIVAWCFLVTLPAIFLAKRRAELGLRVISSTLAMAMFFGSVLLLAFTGYLVPDDPVASPTAAETMNRFYLLHCGVLPIAMAAAMYFALIRPLRDR